MRLSRIGVLSVVAVYVWGSGGHCAEGDQAKDSIGEIIAAGVKQDLTYREQETELKKAQADYELRWRKFLPTLSVSTSESRQVKTPEDQADLGKIHETEAILNFNLFSGGSSSLSWRQDALSYERQQARTKEAYASVTSQVSNEVLTAIFLQKRKEHLLLQIENRNRQEELAKKKYGAGVLSEQEWLQTAVAKDFQEAELLTTEQELASIENRLTVRKIALPARPDWPVKNFVQSLAQLQKWDFGDLESNREIVILKKSWALKKNESLLAKSSYLPSVDYFLSGKNSKAWTMPEAIESFHGVRLTWTLGDQGSAGLQAKKANFELQFLEAQLLQKRESISLQRKTLLDQYQRISQRLVSLTDSIAKSDKVIQSMRKAFQSGRISVSELLQQENNHLDYLTAYEGLIKEFHLQLVNICIEADTVIEKCHLLSGTGARTRQKNPTL